ncbi:MAG: LytR C-terminal domain-containing protein [Actinobacteria bacterium]|nr:LytR C-terminal domain-containing protein [Actinomycetota bacterium]
MGSPLDLKPTQTHPDAFGPEELSPRPVLTPEIVPRPGRRSGHRGRTDRRQRRRRALALAVVVAAVTTLLLVVVSPVRDRLGRLVPSREGADPVAADSGTLLLAWPTGDDGGAVAMLLGAARGADRAGALLIPGHTQIEVPSFGPLTVGETLRTAGVDVLALALENALGYEIRDAVGLDGATLASIFEPATPLEVRLRNPVVLGEQAFPSATQRLTGSEVALLLAGSPDDANDFDQLVVAHAVFEAWLKRMDGDLLGLTETRFAKGAGIGDERARGAVEVLDAISRRAVTFDTLDVTSLGIPGGERYTIEADDMEQVEALFPGLGFAAAGDRIRVEILNGTGEAGLASAVARRVVPVGAQVVLTGNAAQFGVKETLIVVQTPGYEDEAEVLADALGVGKLHRPRSPVGVADVSIVVGEDFEAG